MMSALLTTAATAVFLVAPGIAPAASPADALHARAAHAERRVASQRVALDELERVLAEFELRVLAVLGRAG